LWVVGILVLAGAAAISLRIGPPPRISILPELPGIGTRTGLQVVFEEPSRGLGRLTVEVEQGTNSSILAEKQHQPLAPWKLWGDRVRKEQLELEAGSANLPWLRPGEATVRATAWRAGTWLRKPEPVVQEITLPVRLRPPSLAVHSSLHYVAQGGSGTVVYRVGETARRDGVEVGERWFPGFPLPGGDPGMRFALFAAPFDLEDPDEIRLVAEDDVENRGEQRFVDRFFPRSFSEDTIRLSDEFMQKVVPEILAATPEIQSQGELLDDYLQLNRELRSRNARTLEDLAAKSVDRFLWRRPFMPMPGTQVMSSFADRRTYLYEGAEVDRQDHLGFDLASVRRAEVPSANDGVVALARYFGIYGNAVVIDHGYGLMSLYGHLSSIEVEEGEEVVRGQLVGRSGETGLAGGDHLHFTMLLGGVPVTPMEWWDGRWIRDRLARKLGEALPLEL